jgi:hypothetical protein
LALQDILTTIGVIMHKDISISAHFHLAVIWRGTIQVGRCCIHVRHFRASSAHHTVSKEPLVASTSEASVVVGTSCIGVTVVGVGRAFINVNTVFPIAHIFITRMAITCVSTITVHACGVTAAHLLFACAFVVVLTSHAITRIS